MNKAAAKKILNFLLFFCIMGIVIGGICTLYILRGEITPAALRQKPVPENAGESLVPYNFLLICHDSESNGTGFILLQLNPKTKTIPLSALPPETLAEYDGRKDTLASYYRYGKGAYVQKAAESLGVSIDGYIDISAKNLEKVIDLFGGAELNIKENIILDDNGVKTEIRKGVQSLRGKNTVELFKNGNAFDNRKNQVLSWGDGAATIINQNMNSYFEMIADYLYRVTVNMVDTNLNYTDYVTLKPVLVKISENKGIKAIPYEVTGQEEKNSKGKTVFILNSEGYSVIKQFFRK